MDKTQLQLSKAKRAQMHKSKNISPGNQVGGMGHVVDLPVFISVVLPDNEAPGR